MTADTGLPAPAAPVAQPDGEEILRIDDLNVHFPVRGGLVRALQGVNFKIERGKTLGVIGESGSGKSVTAQCIMRILPKPGLIAQGEILAQGKANLHAPWLGITGFAVLAVMLSLLIFIGEAVRDAFDPRKTIA